MKKQLIPSLPFDVVQKPAQELLPIPPSQLGVRMLFAQLEPDLGGLPVSGI